MEPLNQTKKTTGDGDGGWGMGDAQKGELKQIYSGGWGMVLRSSAAPFGALHVFTVAQTRFRAV